MQMRKQKLLYLAIHRSMHPMLLLCAGMLVLVSYLLIDDIGFRLLQVCLFYFLAASEKQIKLHYYVFLVLSVLFFYLLVPAGRVLYQFGPISITQGALEDGLFRGLTLSGYVFLSLWAISPQLKVPGNIGRMLSISLQFFTIFFEGTGAELRKKALVGKDTHERSQAHGHFAAYIDETVYLHISLYLNQSNTPLSKKTEKKSIAAYVAVSLVSIASWILVFIK